jgi:hypothetical protein
MTIDEISKCFYCFNELKKLSHKIHHQDENACNYGLTSRQEKMLENYLIKAEKLADELGLKAYHQGDPRGCSLYLIDETMNNTNYNNGIAIY